jgi:hypothetical protein
MGIATSSERSSTTHVTARYLARCAAVLISTILTTGCSAGLADGTTEETPVPGHVVNEVLTLTLTVKSVAVKVGEEVWVSGTSVCAGLPKCETLFVPVVSSDERVLSLTERTASYKGLPAERFRALTVGRALLTPTSACPVSLCHRIGEFIPTVMVDVLAET